MNFHWPQSLFADGLAAYVCIRVVFQRRAAKVPVRATRAGPLDRLLVMLVVLGQVVLPAVYILSPWLNGANVEASSLAASGGVLLWLVGLWLFWRSHHDLGINWSVTLEVRSSHELITHGVYRSIRHPMYASFLLLALAQGLLLPNWVAGWSALLAVAILCVVRVPREESMMREFFGDAYRRYGQVTGAVFPRAKSDGVV